MVSTSQGPDARAAALSDWVRQVLGTGRFDIAPASADASFRRYFRISGLGADAPTRIAMDAPPAQEDCRPFIAVAALLREAGLNAPHVLAQDLERGFLLLSDLGTQTYLHVLNETNAPRLFGDASAALVRWQLASRPGVLPPYDAALLQRELQLFPDWYIARHLKVQLSDAQRQVLTGVFARIVADNLAQPAVFVHRDFMPRNLMVSDPNPGILDFQDAVYGPITYDVACLFKDAFISWPDEMVLDGTIRYWERARKAGLPVDADFGAFFRACEWMGLQRHLKVLGIFARINYRDGKPAYLEDAPRFLGYVRAVAGRYGELAPLLRLLDELEGAAATQVGYTF